MNTIEQLINDKYRVNNSIFVFIDESGNFDFSVDGTKYFVLTAITTFNPLGKEKLEEIKYSLLKNGTDIEYFHASEDKQKVRDKVFTFISELNDINIDSIIIQKNKTNPTLYQEHCENKFYQMVLRSLLEYVFRGYSLRMNLSNITVILSSIFNKNKRELISKTMKEYLMKNFEKQLNIYFHDAKSNKNAQIADYCCWAIYRKWEKGDLRSHDLIKNKIRSEFDMFAKGNIKYY